MPSPEMKQRQEAIHREYAISRERLEDRMSYPEWEAKRHPEMEAARVAQREAREAAAREKHEAKAAAAARNAEKAKRLGRPKGTTKGQKVDAQIVSRDKFIQEGPKLSRLEEIRWIYNHINIENVGPEEAPNPGCWGELMEIQENQDLRRDFYNKHVPRLVAEDEKDKGNRFKDDGSDLLDFITEIREAHSRAVSRARAEEL